MTDDAARLSDVYHRALALPPEERRVYLREACAGDEALRAEVESLLRYEAAPAGVLDRPGDEAVGAESTVPRNSILGRQLGPYTILAPLGAGGMGEVYRARDTKLRRAVALKILPPHLVADPERRARFAREARLLATLNHPHIGAIYGLEDADDLTALVLELVEGPTLADRLERGPLPLSDSLLVARQIAEAMDAAHEKGIVHRDLKPSNIVLHGAPGSDALDVKVLDFGLAKSMGADRDVEAVRSPGTATADGRILGTPAYMSPEQARGLAVDKRTDIWAFGCVLFEMLTGRRAFEGETVTDTLAGILEHEPDWTRLPLETPASIRTLLRRCLRKNPRKRLHDMADALLEIDEVEIGSESLGAAGHEVSAAQRHRGRLGWITAALLAGALLIAGVLYVLPPPAPPDVSSESVEFGIGPPPGHRFGGPFPRPGPFGSSYRQFALAPDGSHLVVVAVAAHVHSLWVRPLGSSEYRQLRGTEGAFAPFWSPDSRLIGFFAAGKLKVIPVTGGNPVDVVDIASPWGGAWSRDGVILLASADGPLLRVSSTGGTPTPVTALADGEASHRWPWFLPDGRHFLFLSTGTGPPRLRLGSLESTDSTPLGAIRSNAVYASGHLLFVDEGLMAQRFDLRTRRLTGAPFRLSDEMTTAPNGRGPFTVSETGLLAYSGPARLEPSLLTWMDRAGNRVGTIAEPGYYINLGLSSDNRRVSASILAPEGNIDIWVIDLDRGGDRRRVTTDPGLEYDPDWSHDGTHIAFNSTRLGPHSLFRRRLSDADGRDELLARSDVGPMSAPAWSPDDDFIVFSWRDDLWILPLADAKKPRVVLETPFKEWEPALSPDGRWIAYSSDVTGRREIYVRPFRSGEHQVTETKISRDGGLSPRWARNGEIFFLSPDGTMMSSRVDVARGVQPTIPETLFPTGLEGVTDFHAYDVAGDGQRFLVPVLREVPGSNAITVITNWTSRVAK